MGWRVEREDVATLRLLVALLRLLPPLLVCAFERELPDLAGGVVPFPREDLFGVGARLLPLSLLRGVMGCFVIILQNPSRAFSFYHEEASF